jgi:A/G-specific adenine glycosylase
MLVRTKSSQVARIWHQFFQRYPDIQTLAQASDRDLEEAFSSLGLSWRTKLLREFAHQVVSYYAGRLPATVEELRRIPILGEYAAGAVSLQVHGEGAIPVDAGIARFLSRFFGIEGKGELRRNRRILQAAEKLNPCSRERFFALLDLSRLVCIPHNPRCETCPVQEECIYFAGIKNRSPASPGEIRE